MKIILLIIFLICTAIWLYRAYHRRGVEAKFFDQLSDEKNNKFIEIWYDGTSGKICLRRLTKEPITIEISDDKGKRILLKNFPKSQYITKISVRGKLESGMYRVTTFCCNETYQKDFMVRGCVVKIVYKNPQ